MSVVCKGLIQRPNQDMEADKDSSNQAGPVSSLFGKLVMFPAVRPAAMSSGFIIFREEERLGALSSKKYSAC